MKQRFIEWEQDPDILARFNTGKLIDAGALRHVICNVDPPEGVSFEDTMKVLNEVAEAIQLIPSQDRRKLLDANEIIGFLQIIKMDTCATNPQQSDLAREYVHGWKDGCECAQKAMELQL